MRKIGTNSFAVEVTDISGGPLTGYTTNWSYIYSLDNTIVTSTPTTVSEVTGASGFYSLDIPLNTIGEGFLKISNSSLPSGSNITPNWYDLEITNYSLDDVYNATSIPLDTSLSISSGIVSSYDEVSYYKFKEGDDFVINYTIPDTITTSISGYSNFKMSLRSDTALTSPTSGAGYIGDFTVNVTSTSLKQIEAIFPNTLSLDLVTSGLRDQIYYSDLQATDSNGYKKTLAEFTITVTRQFTR